MAVDEEEVEKEEDGPMVVAINVGESGGIGPRLVTSISMNTESPNTHEKTKRVENGEETYHQIVHSPTTALPSAPNSSIRRSTGHHQPTAS